MKPSWASDEKPATRRTLVCVNAIAPPYRIPATAITSRTSWNWIAASGYSGSATRRKPYAPTFDSTPDSTATTAIGAAR